MKGRPLLVVGMDCVAFGEHYYLKEELIAFCREAGLSTAGGKQILTERIIHFLDTGDRLVNKPVRKQKKEMGVITPESLIEQDLVCSEKHREFFRQMIGSTFSFNVPFQAWLKSHAGNTYAEAVCAWHRLKVKNGSSCISSQFEYNTYVREFFKHNSGKSLQDAIRCWNYKKTLSGSHRYEPNDLTALYSEIDF